MHFLQFLQLREDDQLETLWYNGEQIGRRKEGEFLVLLYQVEGFYVEVFYHTKQKLITKYVSFEDTDRLDPYISNMDLSLVYRYMRKGAKIRWQVSPGEGVESSGINRKKNGHPAPASKQGFWEKLRSLFHK
jgi:hypothetical protein